MNRPPLESHSFVQRVAAWGLAPVPHDEQRARRAERLWRWPSLLILLATIPAFYAELLQPSANPMADGVYLAAALVLATSLLHVAWLCRDPWRHVLHNPTDLMLILGLVAAALLPGSQGSGLALALRLGVAFLSLLRMLWATQHLINRGGLTYLLSTALVVLLACGMGFWWLEPTTPTLSEGLWLAFTTAATVGFGDVVPTTPASKIFAVFVVLLGFGVLTLVTAAIATSWVETEERRIEREILRDMRREMGGVRDELTALRDELAATRKALDQASKRQAM
ncbi:potassium channel family protein [Ideonella sp.]|uniref:potassium channel family protein n=1 Tax=Ideonella sp. TaxID=1929293 RepID=UPI003BB7C7DA